MRLTDKTVAALALPEGKLDQVFWDDDILVPAFRLDGRGLSPLNQRTSVFASRAKRLIA
jgi:hypothetical protein